MHAHDELLRGYSPPAGGWDELISGDTGAPREHWEPLLKPLGALGRGELNRRWRQALRLLRDGGVTSNSAEASDFDRPWVLDPAPHIISSQDWRLLEAATAQRARLLNGVIADLYGPQSTLRGGLLPPEMIYGAPGFLRPCHGAGGFGESPLRLYAMDVGRRQDGSWVVLGDRTQAPGGIGYVLENRLVTLRTIPEIYRECGVRHLLGFFQRMRETLAAIAPRNIENPRIVLLSAGASQECYFEQIYLARTLGYPLVEGGDLTVRDNGVYLKTLGGLQPVDVILRWIDDSACDPLELRYDSLQGAPGLVQVAASRKVVIANALGSGLLNTAAFMPYLAGLSRFIIGEDLILPGLETDWLGSPGQLDRFLAQPNQFILKPAHSEGSQDPIIPSAMSQADRQALLDRVKAQPEQFTAQERVTLSTAPCWNHGRLEPHPLILRLYAVSDMNGDYAVMPGGRALLGAKNSAGVVTLASSQMSKDVWVIGENPSTQPTLLQHMSAPAPLLRSGMDMPSRVADHLYWLGRYTERAEGAVRLLRAVVARVSNEGGDRELPELSALLGALARSNLTSADIRRLTTTECRDELQSTLVKAVYGDSPTDTCLRALFRSMRRAAWMARDRVSQDAWRALSRLDGVYSGPVADGQSALTEALAFLDDAILPLSAFAGLAMESTTRGPGWRFLDIGRRIERAVYTQALLRPLARLREDAEPHILQALLEIADSSMTYRARYLSALRPAAVVDLLLRDETSPRSIAFQIASLHEHIEALPRDPSAAELEPERRLILAILNQVRLSNIETLTTPRSNGRRGKLAEVLDCISNELPKLSDILSARYFSHAETGWRAT